MEKKKTLLRSLPKVDECLNRILAQLSGTVPQFVVKKCIQKCIDQERLAILENPESRISLSNDEWDELFIDTINEKYDYNLKCVYNCTGVVIHTNLGRSLLPSDAVHQLSRAGSSYSNLEFDLRTGKRGTRYSLVEEIICDLTGAEAALVVNNNAAAVMLVLDTFAKGKEVIVSRGQLVEIGGSFRIPDVMAKSGAHLVEVGATNRTHVKDYKAAITDETAMLLRVHTSNFKILGFTSDVSPEEMVQLAREDSLITMEDLGSGSLLDLSRFGLVKEPTVQEVVKAGIDVVTFSGDKLLGGPQAGIIVGAKDIISQIKKNPLNRALRIDKFTLASLEAVLRIYYDIPKALQQIPTLKMLTVDISELKKRAQRISRRIKQHLNGMCDVQVLPVDSKVGGGAMPDCNLPSYGVILKPHEYSLHSLEDSFRHLEIPIIGRVENERYVLDVRTIQDEEVVGLSAAIISFFS
ncbi:L-seryl-tRNA(Sec) selenium transferase [Desulfopila sp. IMCC35008]|uniref:L-seryl-tRNA(Sec) selenium transferase n=1 Tax=Desulfopila sp. IMCC35008 TaxID=2653858 RepID=UPI0013D205A0|nr:L-seryl-tRNA(Sec) selenium transferase [Desulfopila sp. IMCC35008]